VDNPVLAWDFRLQAIVSVHMGVIRGAACYREVGAELVARRTAAGLTGQQMADISGWTRTKVLRMEKGDARTSVTDLIHYLVQCKVTLPDMQPILNLARTAEHRLGYWLSDRRIGNSLSSLIYHESAARQSIGYDPILVPGLLQTEWYMRARIAAEPGVPLAEVEANLRTRVERQRILQWRSPTRFTFFVHEQALRLCVGSPAVMHEQLLHLVLMSAVDHVTLRVIPSAAGERGIFGGPFRFLEHVKHEPLVYLDTVNGGLFLEDRRYVADYWQLLPDLDEVSLDEGESRSFAADLADEYDRGSQPDAADHLEEEQLQ
jgi:transcriptional regulator with XRE-family HTH domain